MKHLRRLEKIQKEQRMAMIKPVRSLYLNQQQATLFQVGSKGRVKAEFWIWSRDRSGTDADHDS